MEYIERLMAQVKKDGYVAVLYPELPRATIASYVSQHYPEYIVEEFNGFSKSVMIRKRKRAFSKSAPLNKDGAHLLLGFVHEMMEQKKKEKPQADQWRYVFIGAECGYLYDVIAYLDDISEYKVTKSKHAHGISFVLKNKRGTYDKYGFKNMGVGDYYTLDDDEKLGSVRAYASSTAKKLGIKLKVSAKERRIYRIA